MTKFYDYAVFIWYLFFLILIIFIPLELPSKAQSGLLSVLFILLISYNYTKKNIYLYQRILKNSPFDRYVRKRMTNLETVSFFVLLFIMVSLSGCIDPIIKNSLCIGTLAAANIELMKKFYQQFLFKQYYKEIYK